MSEIEKMYENAGIAYEERYNNCTLNKEGQCELKCSCDICKYSEERYIYPPFTAEKQLELIKNISPAYPLNYHIKCFQGYSFEEGLAKCINNLWQYLTAEEKQQVKGILE